MNELNLENFNIDKTDWQLVKFGEVAFEPKENCKDLITEGIKHVVGLEHITSEDIHLRRSASTEEATTFTKKFAEGDVLFGRRRAYLKKAARAEFAGVCSGDIIVMRANQEKLMPDLLPFIVNNEKFFDYAITHSAGGLSPRVKFKDLANYELLLPPKEQQLELAELFVTAQYQLESQKRLAYQLNQTLKSYELFRFHEFTEEETIKLGDVIFKTLSGGTPDTKKASFYEKGEIPWITTKILGKSIYIDRGECLITKEAIENSAAKVLPEMNIVAGTRVGVGKFAINTIPISFSQDINGLFVDHEKVNLEFLVNQLNSFLFKHKMSPFMRGTTIKGITKDDLLMLKLFLPDLSIQKKILGEISSITNSILLNSRKVENSNLFLKSIIHQVF